MFRLQYAAVILVAGSAILSGQRYTSPPARTSAKIAGKEITVEYFAPSMHGRKIMGALVPYNRVWCPGANVATGLTTEAPLQIGDLKAPKGKYSLWIIPTEKQWTLIVNKQSGQHHLDYDAAQDFGRTRLDLKTLATPVETLKFEVRAGTGSIGRLILEWEATEASVPLKVLQ